MTALIMPRSVRRNVPSSARRAHRGLRLVGPETMREETTVAVQEQAQASRLHLTRRGRFFLVGLPFVTGAAALLVIAAIFLLPATVQASTDGAREPVTQSVTVQSDQTLWDIAVAADPQRDTREVMADIAELNDLSSSALTAGQVLEVPTR